MYRLPFPPVKDGTLWHDGAAFHMLVHRFAAANGSTVGYQVGGHAFSADGVAWHYSPHPAYNSTVRWAGGAQAKLYRRERPKLLFSSGGELDYLYNGAWPCHIGPENDDRQDGAHGCATFTIVTKIETGRPVASHAGALTG